MNSIRTALAVAIVAVGWSGMACADDFSGGDYDVRGANPDGSKYSGKVEITVTSDSTCRIHWDTGGSESDGICMRNSNVLAAGYVLGGEAGLVIYEIRDDGVLDGLWTVADHDGVGEEVLVPE